MATAGEEMINEGDTGGERLSRALIYTRSDIGNKTGLGATRVATCPRHGVTSLVQSHLDVTWCGFPRQWEMRTSEAYRSLVAVWWFALPPMLRQGHVRW